MTIGPLTRAVESRVESRSSSGTKGLQPSSISGTLPSFSQLAHGFPSGLFTPHLSSSPDSSRDVSPARSRQPSGTIPSLFPEWHSSARALVTDQPSTPVEVASIKSDKVLNEMPSFGYERGLRALWLDRHPSLKGPCQYSQRSQDDGEPKPQGLPQPPPDEAPDMPSTAAQLDFLTYGPSWNISQSLVWSLAERYIRSARPPSPFDSAPQDPTSTSTPICTSEPTASTETPAPRPLITTTATTVTTTTATTTTATTITATTATATTATATTATATTPPNKLAPPPPAADAGPLSCTNSHRSRAELPLPSGIGPVGLCNPDVPGSNPSRRFRSAALCLIARSRLELKKGLRAAEAHHDEVVVVAAADSGAAAAEDPGASPSPTSLRRKGSLRIAALVSEAVADALAASPSSRTVVRRRVRALVAGVSVAYTAVNLGGCATALVHVDFAHNFASSAKAVLDFMVTAPSVTCIASDLIQIGVAVGLGMAQRRPPC